jgi:four helix bundle protein
MPGVHRFEDFDCWKLSNELKLGVYALIASAPANIAEGFGRRSDTEFARFLDFARGSLNECRSHITDARDRKFIDEEERLALDSLASRAVGAIAGLQRYLRRRKRKRA